MLNKSTTSKRSKSNSASLHQTQSGSANLQFVGFMKGKDQRIRSVQMRFLGGNAARKSPASIPVHYESDVVRHVPQRNLLVFCWLDDSQVRFANP